MLTKYAPHSLTRERLAAWLRRLFSALFARRRAHQTFTIRGGAGTD
ncbi:MAG: hypothetical protein HYZ26_07695 [Chloroflexi bacterium]|nr:hypothetical protein [Chloroflexota bacterium]